jgi:F0F1-type ATP synthase membrane subunit c/vacuolar-type H+-ATPase subunit K
MTALKGLALAAALIVGTSSLAMAQAQGSSGPDGQATDGAADNPSTPGSGCTCRHVAVVRRLDPTSIPLSM